MEVFSNRLLSITEDMNNTLVRSSFSTNIKERRDCSVALFDGGGRLIAQGGPGFRVSIPSRGANSSGPPCSCRSQRGATPGMR